MEKPFTAVFSSEQTVAEMVCKRLQHQRRMEAANQFLRKQERERNQSIQQRNQSDTESQDDNITLENTNIIPTKSKKEPPQQAAGSQLSIPTPFVVHVITERQEGAFCPDAISFTEIVVKKPTNFLSFENYYNDIFFWFSWLKNNMTLFSPPFK